MKPRKTASELLQLGPFVGRGADLSTQAIWPRSAVFLITNTAYPDGGVRAFALGADELRQLSIRAAASGLDDGIFHSAALTIDYGNETTPGEIITDIMHQAETGDTYAAARSHSFMVISARMDALALVPKPRSQHRGRRAGTTAVGSLQDGMR
ncbi:MAG: hypothetical protein HY053_09090 [Proteobacteria bacterium]|nr:hypothetical protein [Pseudomonadota bacterium]